VGLGALLGRGAWWYWQQPLFTASYATHTSQMRTVRLADGQDGVGHSQLELAPRTALNVALYRQRRIVTMTQGEVRFDVLPDAQRPFEVLTRAARIQVVGTVFTVRDRGGPVTVGVAQGQVRVRVLSHAADAADARAPDQESAVIDLRPGQAIDVRDGQAEPVRRADPADMAAWREGWLVFDNSLLADALTTINAYRAKPIQTDDPRVGALRLTGRFRANDSAGLVAALPTILPLHALTRPDGSVQLRLR
jgi:transmembrane sensor